MLSDAQKDALLLRAVQSDPEFYERILEQASAPLTEEAAEARLLSLDSEGMAGAVRWFLEIGVPANAITLLVAVSQRALGALEGLADAASTTQAREAAADEASASSSGSGGGGGGGGAATALSDELLVRA